MSPSCTGILLAAGQGTRFGGDKLLHPLTDGTPMAVACARILHAALAHCIAVVGDAHSELARQLAAEDLQVVANPRACEGMGTSIARGVAASRDAGGWVIALADMPGVPVRMVQAVVDGLEGGASIIAPVSRGQRGHPVGFASLHGPALLALRGDRGAREVITRHHNDLVLIETGDQGVIQDIDSPDALPGRPSA